MDRASANAEGRETYVVPIFLHSSLSSTWNYQRKQGTRIAIVMETFKIYIKKSYKMSLALHSAIVNNDLNTREHIFVYSRLCDKIQLYMHSGPLWT